MFHRCFHLTLAIVAATCPLLARGQAAAPVFVVCVSQANQPTVYFSGVLRGPRTALPSFQGGFTQYLVQHYAYKGFVNCLPANNASIAQTVLSNQSAALRNAKKNVVTTGWVETVAAAGPPPAAAAPVAKQMVAPTTTRAAGAPTVKAASVASSAPAAAAPAASTAAGGSGGGMAQVASVLGSIFGGGASAGGGAGAGGGGGAASAGAGGGSGAGGNAGSGSSSAGSAGSAVPIAQVTSALSSVFSSKAPTKAAPADGALGSAQAQNTKLVVYGCGRQDSQVACVTDLGNQNQKDTLVQASDVWKDAFIVDDRGDRHVRTAGFFLNVDGDQRPQLDISYGKTARFVLMFDGVPAKVQKVALRSATGGLDVEEIVLVAPGGGMQGAQAH